MQPADTGRERERVRHRHEPHRAPAELDVQAGGDAPRVHAGVDALLARLIGRDLGQVEDVAHVQPVAGDLDAREPIDGEVAERVRLRGDGGDEGGRQDGEGEQTLHGVPFRAVEAHRTEKFGLSASARP